MFTASFAKALAERVITAFAVSLISVLFVGGEVLDVRAIHWGQALGIAGGAALLSLLKGIVAGQWLGPKGSPSLVRDPAAAGEPVAMNGGAEGQERLSAHGNVRKVGGYNGGPSSLNRGSGNYTTGGYPGGDGGGEPVPPPRT